MARDATIGSRQRTEASPAKSRSVSQREQVGALSVNQLIWMRFKRSRPAVGSGILLLSFYLIAALAGFVAPYGVRTTHDAYPAAPPHGLHWIDADGKFHWWPFVYGLDKQADLKTFRPIYTPNTSETYPIRLFFRGVPYTLLGLFETDIHLFGVEEPGKVFLLGTDTQGRDLLSRVLYGAQVSLTVGLLGVFLSLIIGSVMGTISGLFGGIVDAAMQRVIEVLLAFPQIPLWLALAAAVPATWSSIKVYFGVTVVLSIVSWAGLARQVRAKVLALREEDFVMAARLSGTGTMRMVMVHLLPNVISHILVVATLSIPSMILGETALSFLGLGIRPPMTSWGVLLSEAQHTRVLLQQPWLITPVIFVIVTVICFNFLGDGFRDAIDPFAR
jgi:peptide/nickel transport system permease protein